MGSFKKSYHSLGEKKHIVSLIIVAIVFGGLFFTMRSSKVELQGEAIKISGAYGINIDINDIKDVSLEEALPKNLSRTNGIDFFGQKYIGKFSSADLGKMKLFVYAAKGPYLHITLNNEDYKHIIIACKDKDQTQALYKSIVDILR